MRELGLISILEEERSNAAAWDVQPTRKESFSGSEENKDGNPTTPKKKKKHKLVNNPTRARKSARLRGENPDGTKCPSACTTTKRKDRDTERREMVAECRRARQQAALKVMEEGAEKAAKENPTATYEHCLMRVRTMSDKALLTRVKVMERAAGKHCVVKMAIFKSCLQDEGKWDLADKASEALERLKGLQAPPKRA